MRKRITIRFGESGKFTRDINARVRDGWAIHRSYEIGGKPIRGYSVTHIQTGTALAVEMALADADNVFLALSSAMPNVSYRRLVKTSGRWRRWLALVNNVRAFREPPRTRPQFRSRAKTLRHPMKPVEIMDEIQRGRGD